MARTTTVAAAINDSTLDVTRETLEDTPSRVLPFLRAVGTSVPIRSILRAHGFTDAEQKLGWTLLHAVSGFTEDAKAETVDVKVRDAINSLDAWDEDGFRIVRAALTRLHPARATFVLAGIGPSVGAGAVVGVKTLLQRLDALKKSPERKATLSQSATEIEAPDEAGKAAREETYVKAFGALRVGYVDWSEMARSIVKRRDYLIRLGLAKRFRPEREHAPNFLRRRQYPLPHRDVWQDVIHQVRRGVAHPPGRARRARSNDTLATEEGGLSSRRVRP